MLLATLMLAGLAPLAPAGATHCGTVIITDDGTHSVSETGGFVTVNGAGVMVECAGFVVGVYESYSTVTRCNATRITDDGAHGVMESGGTVFVNGVGVSHTCLVRVFVPESFFLP